jgi:ELWxxDGT repeat protein
MPRHRASRPPLPFRSPVESLEGRTLLSLPPATLVKDIRTTPTPQYSSNPVPFRSLDGAGVRTVFVADDGEHGRELWVTDGTEAGTVMIKDVRPGPSSSGIDYFSPVLNGRAYFAANSSGVDFETDLWVTDGTPAGTRQLEAYGPPAFTGIDAFTSFNGKMYYAVADDWDQGGLWVTDGTEAGTQRVSPHVGAIPGPFVPYKGELYYFVRSNLTGGTEMWKTDGTPGGTVMVRTLPGRDSDFIPSAGTVMDGVLYFLGATGTGTLGLWRSDGTSAGTSLVTEVPSGITKVVPAEHRLVMTGGRFGTPPYPLWVSDGTAAGTQPLSALAGALATFAGDPIAYGSPNPTALAGSVYLFGRTMVSYPQEWQVWKTDGTGGGTRLVKSFPGARGIRGIRVLDGYVLFGVRGNFPGETLWRTDGTDAGTEPLLDFGTSNLPAVFEPAGDRVFFNGADAEHGVELWSMQRPTPAQVFVRGSAWSAAFKQSLDDAGDGAYGFRVGDQGAGGVLPWVNVNEVVVRLAEAPLVAGTPSPAMVAFQSQRGLAYAVTQVRAVPGDPKAFVFALDRPLGGDAATGGDRLTLTVRGAGIGGADLALRLDVLQGDVDRGGTVLAQDFSEVKKRFFRSAADPGPAGDTQYTPYHDVDGSGEILANDYGEVKRRFFHALPPAPVAPAAGATASRRQRPTARELFSVAPVLG